MAIPQMFNPIKPPVKMGVVWALWQKVTPETVKTTGAAIQKQTQERQAAAQSAPMDFSEKEIAFLKQVKAQGMDKNEALAFIQQKRQQPPARTTGQKIWAAAAWFSQWIADVWQNTVWQLGRLWEKWWEVIARGLWFDESKIQQVVQDNTRRREQGILPMFLWDMATSKQATVGRTAGKIAGSTALAIWAGAVGWWAITSALWPASTILWWIGKGALAWAGWGALSTQAATIGWEGRFATAKETAIGAALGWVVGWIAWGRAVSQANKVQGLFSEKWTAKQLEQAAREGRVKFTSWVLKSRWEITPTERVANGIKVLTQKIKWISSKDPQKIINEAGNIGKKMATDLADDLKNIKVGTMTRFKAGLTNQIDEVAWLADERTNSQVKQINNLKVKIPKAKTADDLWKIRMEWDDLFSEAQKNLTQSPAPSTAKANRLRQSVRKILNDELDDVVSNQWWPNVKKAFYDMSSIIEARNNLVKNIPNLVKEKPSMLIKWLKWAWLVAGWAWIWGALQSLWK